MAVSNYVSPLREAPFEYPFPPLVDIRHVSWPPSSEKRREAAVVTLAQLVAYLLERLGFSLADFELVLRGESYDESLMQHASNREILGDSLVDSWFLLTSEEPGEAIGSLHAVVIQLGAAVPRWWLEQVDGIPEIEGTEVRFNVGWWAEDGISVIEDELPPWEVSQTAA